MKKEDITRLQKQAWELAKLVIKPPIITDFHVLGTSEEYQKRKKEVDFFIPEQHGIVGPFGTMQNIQEGISEACRINRILPGYKYVAGDVWDFIVQGFERRGAAVFVVVLNADIKSERTK